MRDFNCWEISYWTQSFWGSLTLVLWYGLALLCYLLSLEVKPALKEVFLLKITTKQKSLIFTSPNIKRLFYCKATLNIPHLPQFSPKRSYLLFFIIILRLTGIASQKIECRYLRTISFPTHSWRSKQFRKLFKFAECLVINLFCWTFFWWVLSLISKFQKNKFQIELFWSKT